MYKNLLINIIMECIVNDNDVTMQLFGNLDPTYDDVRVIATSSVDTVGEVAAQGLIKLIQDGTHQLRVVVDDEGTLSVEMVTPV